MKNDQISGKPKYYLGKSILKYLNNVLVLSSFCITHCATERDGEMLQCSNHLCAGAWFHLTCVDLEEAPQDDWYCSQDCRISGGYIYCICHSRQGAEDQHMLRCALGVNCLRHEKYHPRCIGADPAVIQGKV